MAAGAVKMPAPIMAFMPMIIAAIVYIFVDLFGVFFPTDVGNIAHLSGIAVGLIAGLFIRIINKDFSFREKRQRVSIPENYMRNWEDNYMR